MVWKSGIFISFFSFLLSSVPFSSCVFCSHTCYTFFIPFQSIGKYVQNAKPQFGSILISCEPIINKDSEVLDVDSLEPVKVCAVAIIRYAAIIIHPVVCEKRIINERNLLHRDKGSRPRGFAREILDNWFPRKYPIYHLARLLFLPRSPSRRR